ncbi:MAG: hypothetical protein WC100_18885 [Sterolibacterium sp.]
MDEQQSKGTETYAEAATRLLARMDERAKKASGGLNQPEKFNSRSLAVSPANENEEGRVPQLGGVSRGTRGYLPLTGGVPVEGTQQGEDRRCVVSGLLIRQDVNLTADTHHAPDPSERVEPIDRAVTPRGLK